MEKYDHSMYKLMYSVYPEYNWELYKFDKVTQTGWETVLGGRKESVYRLILVGMAGRVEFVKYLEKQLNIQNENEWNNVSASQLQDIRLPPKWKYVSYFFIHSNIQIRLKDVLTLVREVYTTSSILKYKTANYKKGQFSLQTMLKTIFPSEGIF